MMNGLNGWKSIDKGPCVAKERERLKHLHQQALDRIRKDDGQYKLGHKQSTEQLKTKTTAFKKLHCKFGDRGKLSRNYHNSFQFILQPAEKERTITEGNYKLLSKLVDIQLRYMHNENSDTSATLPPGCFASSHTNTRSSL